MSSWICDGIPKNGQQYANAPIGGHTPYENHGPDCLICGLPREAMETAKTMKTQPIGKTKIVGQGAQNNQWLIPVIIAAVVVVLGGGGLALYQIIKPNPNPTPALSPGSTGGFVSTNATNPKLISQGEQILIEDTPDKQKGASAFRQKDWDGAIAAYQTAVDSNPNDPESRIYLHNAKARKTGNPITIAVAVPISLSANSAKEILRGVARYQEEFNQTNPSRLLEVVIANDEGQLTAESLSQDIINASDVLGILGYGIDLGSQQALKKYQDADLTTVSALTTSVVDGTQPMVKTIPIAQADLVTNYLKAASKTLVESATQKHSPLTAVIFYNSDSPYSQQLKQELTQAISQAKGTVIQEIDVTSGNFQAATDIANAQQKGANVGFLALSKNKVSQVVDLAQANAQTGTPLLLMGGDELYNPDTLVQGGDAVKGMVLAVPWSFQPNDPFAKDAIASWKGRVSWRTATAYDATKVLADAASQNPSRAGVAQLLKQGVPLPGKTTSFNIFNEVPLVEAVPGTAGPAGSQMEFSAIK